MAVVSGQHDVSAGKLEELHITPSGQSFTMTWDGPRPMVEQLVSLVQVAADEVHFRSEGAYAKITASYSGPRAGVTEIPTTSVELDTGMTTIPLETAPRYAAIPLTVLKAVKSAVDNTANSETEDLLEIEVAAASLGAPGAAIVNLAKELYRYLVRGHDDFKQPVQTVTRSRMVSRRYSTKIDQADVNKIFTTAQLEQVVGSNLLFDVPSLELSADETAIGIRAGWRKTQLRVVDSTNRQRQMVEVWELWKWTNAYADK